MYDNKAIAATYCKLPPISPPGYRPTYMETKKFIRL